MVADGEWQLHNEGAVEVKPPDLMQLRPFTNNFTRTKTTTAASFVWGSGANGDAAKVLSQGSWVGSIPGNNTLFSYPIQTWNFLGTATYYGVALVLPSGKVYASVKFPVGQEWVIGAGGGTKSFTPSFNVLESGASVPATDTEAPTGPVVLIAGGAATTETLDVSLSLYASDNVAVDQMMISNASNFSGAAWETYNTTKSPWTLTGGADGTRTVYAKFRDAAGNVSATASDTITYSQPSGGQVPAAPTNIGATQYVAAGTGFRLSWTAGIDPDDGPCAIHQVFKDGARWPNSSTTFATSYADVTGQTAGSSATWTVKAVDSDSNVSPASTGLAVQLLPAAPSSSSVDIGFRQVTLHPGTSNGSTAFKYYRTSDGSTPSKVIHDATGTATNNQVLSSLAIGTTYKYVFTGTNLTGESNVSAVQTAAIAFVAPTGHSVDAGDTKITLHPGSTTYASSYKYYLRAGADPTTSVYDATGTATNGQEITSLTNGTNYRVIYTGINGVYESAVSTVVNATPAGGLLEISDDFSGTLAKWTTSYGRSAPSIVSGALKGPADDSTSGVNYTANNCDPDQRSSAQVAFTGSGSTLIYISCRGSRVAQQGIHCRVGYTNGARDGVKLQVYFTDVSPVDQEIGIDASNTYSWYALEVEGSSPNITARIYGSTNGTSWTLLHTETGMSGPDSGDPALLVKTLTGGATYSTADNFSGGNLYVTPAVLSDSFTGSNGAAPDTALWKDPIIGGAAGSGVTIQSNTLRLRTISTSNGVYKDSVVECLPNIVFADGITINFKFLQSLASTDATCQFTVIAVSNDNPANYVYLQIVKSAGGWMFKLFNPSTYFGSVTDVTLADTDTIGLKFIGTTHAKVELNGADIIASAAHSVDLGASSIVRVQAGSTVTTTENYFIDDFIIRTKG